MSLDRRGDGDRKDGQVNKKRDFNQSLGDFFPSDLYIYTHTRKEEGKVETRCELHSQRIISDLEPRQWDLQPGMLQGLGLRSSRTPLRG